MNVMTKSIFSALALIVTVVVTPVFGQDFTKSTPGISGYDPVAYFADGKPMRGSGYHVAEFEGVTYAFASKEHKEMFNINPEKYVPVYGGYCAYGVAVGKKFVADPEVWKVVGGKLYLNLDKGIQDNGIKISLATSRLLIKTGSRSKIRRHLNCKKPKRGPLYRCRRAFFSKKESNIMATLQAFKSNEIRTGYSRSSGRKKIQLTEACQFCFKACMGSAF